MSEQTSTPDEDRGPAAGLEDAEAAAGAVAEDDAAAALRGDAGTGTAPDDAPEDDPDRDGAERFDAG